MPMTLPLADREKTGAAEEATGPEPRVSPDRSGAVPPTAGRPGNPRRTAATRRVVRLALALFTLIAFAACDDSPAEPGTPAEQCGPFPDWQSSPYRLPYPAGRAHPVGQANCSGFGHSEFWKHGYDFLMPIGTTIIAARDGTVGWANDGCFDGDMSCTNLITILHDDGTVALYSHLTNGGVGVESGQRVEAGDTIGLSGNTGYSTEPHLHFSIHPCNDLPGLPNEGYCPSQPATFWNTDPNPDGLIVRRSYVAQ